MAGRISVQSIRTARHQGGFTLMEVLIASLLATVVLMGLVRIWQFSFNMTLSTDDRGAAYNIARQAIENFKTTGFTNSLGASVTTPVTNTTYFDADGRTETSNPGSNSRYKVETTVTTDRLMTTSGGNVPAPLALRTLVVVVKLYPSNTVLHTTGTTLSRSGV